MVQGTYSNNNSALQHHVEKVQVVIWEGWTSDAGGARQWMSTDS
jgi:hypothetical protein